MKSSFTPCSTFSNPPAAWNRLGRLIFVICLGLVAGAVNVQAAPTWNGGGGPNFNWSAGANAGNWTAAIAATASSPIFAGSVGLLNTNDFVTSVNGITFNAGSGAFNLSGNALTVAGTITDSAVGVNEIIGMNILSDGGATRTFTTVSGATNTFAGSFTRNVPGPAVTGTSFTAGGTLGTPAVYQFSGAIIWTNPVEVADASVAAWTMRNNITINLLSGTTVSFKGGFIGVGQNGGSTTAAPTTLNVNSGASLTVDSSANFVIGYNFNGTAANNNTGVVNINGTVTAGLGASAQGYIRLGLNDNAVATGTTAGTINLLTNGVLITSRQIVIGANFDSGTGARNTINSLTNSTGNFLFDGGTLMTDGANDATNWFQSANSTTGTGTSELIINALTSVSINSGGAIIDTAGRNATISYGMTNGATSGGGLTKQGLGALFLDGTNTYTGNTTVSNGTLAGIGSINGQMVVAPSGNLGAGDAGVTVGTFTINSNLTLQGNVTLRINKTGGTPVQDNVTVSGSITYGGILTVTNITSDAISLTTSDTFQLFSVAGLTNGNFTSIVGSPGTNLAYSFNPTNGLLSIVSNAVVSAPVAGFSGAPTNIFVTQSVVFTDLSTGSITNWIWNFGDGNFATNASSANVTNAYAGTGTYAVSLTVSGPGGSNMATSNNYIVVKSPLAIGQPVLSSGSLILSGTNGPIGQQYRILTSTNLATNVVNWIPVFTNMFTSPNGGYNFTNTPLTNNASFFRLVSP